MNKIKRSSLVILYIITWLAIPYYIYQHPFNPNTTIRDRIPILFFTTIFCFFVPVTLYTIGEFIKNVFSLIFNYIKSGTPNDQQQTAVGNRNKKIDRLLK